MAEGTTTSITVRFLVHELDAAGVPVDDLLGAAGLTRDALSSTELTCPLPVFDALWARAASVRLDVGLTLIDRFPPGQMHVVTHLAMRSVDVRRALQAVERYIQLSQVLDRFEWTVSRDDLHLRFVNAELDGDARHNPWFVEHLMSMTCKLFSGACARPLPVRSVRFIAPRQAAPDDYARRFGVLPEFGSSENGMHLDAAMLDWPLQTHDAYLQSILESFADKRLPAHTDSSVDRVRHVVRTQWLRGKEPDMQGVAQACGMSEDALRAALAQHKQTFRRLKDESRRDLARHHLGGQLSLGEIAYLLGFSEPAALQHACKRWFGCPAGEVRREAGAAGTS